MKSISHNGNLNTDCNKDKLIINENNVKINSEKHNTMCNIKSIHHVEFHVGNALQSSFWYCYNFGFQRVAHLRKNNVNHIAIKNGNIILVFKSTLTKNNCNFSHEEYASHGDFVKDVCFEVDDINFIIQTLKRLKHKIIEEPTILKDEFGSVFIAKVVGTTGSIVHTLIQKNDYNGIFLPNYKQIKFNSTISTVSIPFKDNLTNIQLEYIDHVVEAHENGTSDYFYKWYNEKFGLDDWWNANAPIKGKNSAIKARVAATKNGSVQVVLTESFPIVNGKSVDQVQEFINSNNGPGIQHIAFYVSDICDVVYKMKERGVKFLTIEKSYYINLRKRITTEDTVAKELENDLNRIEELNILVDFDKKGYLLQIFTKPMQDRQTLFIEIIQRNNFNGFGAGNFKALFTAVESEQIRRENEFINV